MGKLKGNEYQQVGYAGKWPGQDSHYGLNNRVRRDVHSVGNGYRVVAVVSNTPPADGLRPYAEDTTTLLVFSITMLVLIALTLPIILLLEKARDRCKRSRGVRPVASDMHEEGILSNIVSEDECNNNDECMEEARFRHNDEEYVIVELANRVVQCELGKETMDNENGNAKVLSRTPTKRRFINITDGTTTESTDSNENVANVVRKETGMMTDELACGSSNEKNVVSVNQASLTEDTDYPVDCFYYTRPVTKPSVTEDFFCTKTDHEAQTSDPEKTFPSTRHCKPKGKSNFSECRLITGKSRQFQTATSNTICSTRRCEPSMGQINICRQEFKALCRSPNLTWSGVVECTQDNRRTNDVSGGNQKCTRQQHPNDTNNVCHPHRERQPCKKESKSWWSWW